MAVNYDFGDQWIHHITVEKVHRPAPNPLYPRCGGPPGYERTP